MAHLLRIAQNLAHKRIITTHFSVTLRATYAGINYDNKSTRPTVSDNEGHEDPKSEDFIPRRVQRMRQMLKEKYKLDEIESNLYRRSNNAEGSAYETNVLPENDFYGIEEDLSLQRQSEPKGNVIEQPESKTLSSKQIQQKYTFLRNTRKNGMEKIAEAPFGTIRFDSKKYNNADALLEKSFRLSRRRTEKQDAVPERNLWKINSTDVKKDNLKLEQNDYNTARENSHLSTAVASNDVEQQERQHPTSSRTEKEDKLITPFPSQDKDSTNFFDEQYFPQSVSAARTSPAPSSVLAEESVSPDHAVSSDKMPTSDFKPNFFDEQYFPQSSVLPETAVSKTLESLSDETTELVEDNVSDQQIFSEHAKSGQTPEHATISESKNNREFEQPTKDISASKVSHKLQTNMSRPVINTSKQDYSQQRRSQNTQPSKLLQSATRKQPASDIDSTSASKQDFSQNLIDEQYFPALLDKEEIPGKQTDQDRIVSSTFTQEPIKQSHKLQKEMDPPSAKHTLIQEPSSDDVVVNARTKQELRSINHLRPNLEDPQTAYDMAMKIRKELKGFKTPAKPEFSPRIVPKEVPPEVTETPKVKPKPQESKWDGKVDSKGFRILSSQVQNLDWETRDVVVNILKDSILYENEELVAINKPYGLPSHGGPRRHHSIGQLLEPLAAKLDPSGQLPTLHLVHRLDKETTGVMLLAKTTAALSKVRTMFKKREVIKKYWVITKGVPQPSEGIIDIPMSETEVGNKVRMGLRPDYPSNMKLLYKAAKANSKFRAEAVTRYRVLDAQSSAALVECQPETGLKHQIRCHLAFGLNTPILGDHKYSHAWKIAPQKLHPEILQKLHVRQAKVRHIPMHLHATTLVLPQFLDGRNLFISARLPRHFVQNMRWLKLKPPKK